MARQDPTLETLLAVNRCGFDDAVAHSLRADGFDASEDGTGRGTPLVPVAYQTSGNCGAWETGDVTGALDTGTDPNSHVIAFSAKDHGADAGDIAPTLRSMGHADSHANGGGQVAIAFPAELSGTQVASAEDRSPALSVKHTMAVAFDTTQITSPGNYSQPKDGDPCHPLAATAHVPAVAFTQNQREELREIEVSGALSAEPGTHQQAYVAQPFTIMERGREGGGNLEHRQDGTSNAILTPNGGRGGMGVGAIADHWQVRRLTPLECERLQGFPDGWTQIDWRKKPADQCPDGPRYKAIGNSMAVNVMRWIGERIALAEEIEAHRIHQLQEQ